MKSKSQLEREQRRLQEAREKIEQDKQGMLEEELGTLTYQFFKNKEISLNDLKKEMLLNGYWYDTDDEIELEKGVRESFTFTKTIDVNNSFYTTFGFNVVETFEDYKDMIISIIGISIEIG